MNQVFIMNFKKINIILFNKKNPESSTIPLSSHNKSFSTKICLSFHRKKKRITNPNYQLTPSKFTPQESFVPFSPQFHGFPGLFPTFSGNPHEGVENHCEPSPATTLFSGGPLLV